MSASISVVIPAFNSGLTIRAALLSAINQTTPPDEIIVVDDGSTDDTPRIVRTFGGDIRLIEQRNQGSAVARQTGTDAAKSEFIAYLDADDWWPEEKLGEVRSILGSQKIDFLTADLQRAYPGTAPDSYLPRNSSYFPAAWERIRHGPRSNEIPDLYTVTSSVALDLLLHGFPVYPSTSVVRRDMVNEVGGWNSEFRRCQDFDFVLRVARRHPLYCLDRVHAIIGLHSVNKDPISYAILQGNGALRVLLAHYHSEATSSPYQQQVAQSIARNYCALAYSYRKSNQYMLARKAYAEALSWPGRRLHALPRWILFTFLTLFRSGSIDSVGRDGNKLAGRN